MDIETLCLQLEMAIQDLELATRRTLVITEDLTKKQERVEMLTKELDRRRVPLRRSARIAARR